MMKKLTTIAAAISLSLISANYAKADIQVDKLLSQSDLVFQGEIVNIQYKDSKEGLPHTFVTYQVNELITGSLSDQKVTLRFIGGEQKKGKMTRFLSVSEVPTFENGESDILFVSKNNQVMCPLVACSQGRFRDINGLVASESGRAITRGENSQLHLSDNNLVEQIAKRSNNRPFSKGMSKYENEAKVQVQSKGAILDTQSFVATLKDKAHLLSTKQSKAPINFVSSNAKTDFSFPMLNAVAPNATDSKSATLNSTKAPSFKAMTGREKSDFDRWEEATLEKNGGEPVIEMPARIKKR